jgi:hypothetical protein
MNFDLDDLYTIETALEYLQEHAPTTVPERLLTKAKRRVSHAILAQGGER